MSIANVEDIEEIKKTSIYFRNLVDEVSIKKEKSLRKARDLLDETKIEKKVSNGLLIEAKTREAIALSNMIAACSCEPPIGCPAATREYNEAVKHRKKMEKRYRMAKECVADAEEMCSRLEDELQKNYYSVNEIVNSQTPRLDRAYDDLNEYYSRMSPTEINEVKEYNEWQPKEKEPFKPDDIAKRLDVNINQMNYILNDLYINDKNFKEIIDKYRLEINTKGKDYVKTQVKKNISGRIAEEIVIRGLGSLGESVETQPITYNEDGSYTKTDIIIKNLKQPVILKKGVGMGAREGNDLAIEVKSGSKDYLFSQKEHMIYQTEGHKSSKISCTIVTKNIKDLSPEKNKELRMALEEAGSPIIGVLPRKEEIDNVCINFVLGVEK